MKLIVFLILSVLVMNDSETIRLELNYDKEAKELQIKVDGKDQIELVQIYAGEKMLVEFGNQQVPPWDNTIRLKIDCPAPCKLYYVIQTNDGMRHSMKSKKTDLNKNGSYCQLELPKKN